MHGTSFLYRFSTDSDIKHKAGNRYVIENKSFINVTNNAKMVYISDLRFYSTNLSV